MLDTRRAVRDLREVVLTELLLLLHAERTVIGGDDLQIIRLQSLPQLVLIPLLAQRRGHYVLRAIKAGLVVRGQIEKEILRTRLRERRQTAIARLAHLIE